MHTFWMSERDWARCKAAKSPFTAASALAETDTNCSNLSHLQYHSISRSGSHNLYNDNILSFFNEDFGQSNHY